MTDYKLVKPVGSYRVVDPSSGDVIPREGQMMRLTSWIRRRAREGSLTISDPPPAKPKPKAAPTKATTKTTVHHKVTDDVVVDPDPGIEPGVATVGSMFPRPPRRRRQTTPE